MFHTLQGPITVRGVGLHCGDVVTARLMPRNEVGIIFARTDMGGEVAASCQHVAQTAHATTLEYEGVHAGTTEHLLAALWALGVTHCRVELDGPEVPILDGSALPWCDLLHEAGLKPVEGEQPVFGLREPVWAELEGAQVLGLPHDALRVSAAVDFDYEWAGAQAVDIEVTAESFARELAPARTFAKSEWIEPLRERSLIRGGSIENAVVLEPGGPSTPWRLDGELARHKALDLLGDIALLFGLNGGVLRAHLIGVRAGHPSHLAWMRACLRREALVRL